MPELRLLTFGGLTLTRAGVPLTGPASQRTRLALLALLAASNGRGVSRDKVMGYFWPDSDTEHARGALKQCVYVLRTELGADDVIVGTTDLHLNREVIAADVTEFQDLFRRSEYEPALEIYAGPFLDGVYLKKAPEFERWAAEERARLATLATQMTKRLAQTAAREGDHSLAAQWWQRYLTMDPLSATAAAGAIAALAKSDQPTAALAQFRAYESLLREELGKAPDKSVLDALASPHTPTAGSNVGGSIQPVADGHQVAAGIGQGPIPEREISLTGDAGDSAVFPQKARNSWRPSRALLWAGIAGVLLVAILIGVIRSSNPSMVDTQVVVARFSNQTGDPSLDPIGAMAADWITDELSRSGLVRVTDPATAVAASRDAGASRSDSSRASNVVREIAAATGADIVVSGAYYKNGHSLEFTGRITSSKDDRVMGSIDPVSVASSEVMRGIGLVRQRLLGILAREFDDRLSEMTGSTSPAPTYDAYREYVIGYDLFVDKDWAEAIRHFRRAYELDTTFVTPLLHTILAYDVWSTSNFVVDLSKGDSARALLDSITRFRTRLAPLDRHVLDAMRASVRNDLEEKIAALRAASALAPGSEWTWIAANCLGVLNRPSHALELLKQVKPDRAGRWAPYWIRTIRSKHVLGDYRGEAEAIEQFSRRVPRDNMVRQYDARVRALRGRMREVRPLVEAMLTSGEPRTGERVRAVILDLERHGMHTEAESLFPTVLAWYRSLGPAADERSHRWIAFMLSDLGRDEAARREFGSLATSPHDSVQTPVYLGMLGVLAAKRADTATAVAMSDSIANLPVYWNGENTFWRARISAQLARKQEAVLLLRQAYTEGYPQMDFDHTQRPNFPTLHGYPPFEGLVRSDRPLVAGVRY